jgi:hypothetical protein
MNHAICHCAGCTRGGLCLVELMQTPKPKRKRPDKLRDLMMVKGFEKYAAMLYVEPGDTVH